MPGIAEPARNTPVLGHFDVIVCGGGPAGFIAALNAARAGADVLLVERTAILGGTATSGMMVDFGAFHDGSRRLLGGVTWEFMQRMEAYGGVYRRHKELSQGFTFDVESMIATCFAMIDESPIRLRLHTRVVEALVDDGRMTGVVLESKSGREAALGKVIVDCTGDGDVASRAGADYLKGDDTGRMQPVSLEVIVGGVDRTRIPKNHRELIPAIAEAARNGRWPIPTERFFSWGPVVKRGRTDDPTDGFMFLNVTNELNVDGASAEDLTRAERGCRRQIDPLIRFLHEHASGFEKCYVDRTASEIGVRETRRIVGDAVLTRDDVLTARHFDDGVVPAFNSIDVHDVKGKDFEHEFLQQGTHYQIPWRCFLPRGLDGLAVAGRCLSADHRALGSARVMVVCMPMGEAVGRGAAMAVAASTSLRGLDTDRLRRQIAEAGTVIE